MKKRNFKDLILNKGEVSEKDYRELDFYKSVFKDWDKNPRKGVILIGGVGVGKTALMSALSKVTDIRMASCRNIVRQYSLKGEESLFPYIQCNVPRSTHNRHWCFDDLGSENLEISHFGSKINVMAELIQDRYMFFKNRGILTHFTSNLPLKDLKEAYGIRVYDRLKEMVNPVFISSESLRH